MKLGDTLGGAFKTYAKKPLLFSGLYLAITIPLLLFQVLLLGNYVFQLNSVTDPSQLAGIFTPMLIVYFVLFFILSILVGAVTLGALIKAASKVVANAKVNFMDPIKFALSKFWAYIVLTLRIFWYTMAWVVFLLMIVYPVLNVLVTMMGIDLGGLYQILNLVLTVGIIVFGVIAFIRMLRSFLAYYILFDSEKMEPKDALLKSIALTKGNLWRLIGYMFVIGFILGLISYIVDGFILTPIINSMDDLNTAVTVSSIISFVYAAIIAPIPIIYYYLFYKGLANEKH